MLYLPIVELLNNALNQSAKIRKGGIQLCYYCKCGHYKRKLEVNLEKLVFHCWVCNIKGHITKLLDVFNSPYHYKKELYSLIKDLQHDHNEGFVTQNEPKEDEIVLPKEFKSLIVPGKSPDCKYAINYLKKRGITKNDICRYNIGYCESGPFNGYVIVPSYDAEGCLNYFVGRRYYESKYKNIPYRKPKGSMNVIGFESFINYNEPIILVESPFNAITIRNNAIPLFGKYISKKLYEALIIHHVKKLYICLDTDALNETLSMYNKLLNDIPGIELYMVEILGGKDPNEIGFEQMNEFISQAKKMDFSFFLNKYLINDL